ATSKAERKPTILRRSKWWACDTIGGPNIVGPWRALWFREFRWPLCFVSEAVGAMKNVRRKRRQRVGARKYAQGNRHRRWAATGCGRGAGAGMGADEAGRDRGCGGCGRCLGSDGPHDTGGHPEEWLDEGAGRGVPEGWGIRRRSTHVHEIQRWRCQQGADRL